MKFIQPKLRAFLYFLESSTRMHLAVIAALVVYLFARILYFEYRVVGTVGFTMDDAWIHMTVARNFLEGSGWGIVRGHTLSVSTSPTWTILVAVFYFALRDPVTAVMLLSFLCSLAAALLCYLLTAKLTERPVLGLLAAVILLFHPSPLWGMASGMELPLVLFMLFLSLYLYYSADPDSSMRRIVVPAVIAVSAMTRPELFLLIPLAFLDTFWKLYRTDSSEARRLAFRTFLVQVIVTAVVLAPYFAFNKITGGLWFPTTYYAKTVVRGVGLSAAVAARDPYWIRESLLGVPLRQIEDMAAWFGKTNLFMLLLLVPGAIGFSRYCATKACARGSLLVLAMCVIPYVMGVTSPSAYLSNHASRYWVIFPAMAAVLCGVALDVFLRLGRHVALAWFCAIMLLLAPFRTTYRAIQLVATDVDSTERMYRPVGEYLRDNIGPGAVIAVNDIGVIGYYADRDFIDVMGLASPEIWPAIQRKPGKKIDFGAFRRFLQERKVDYLVLSPQYYPELTNDSKTFKPLKSWAEKYPHGRLISPQVLYKCEWPS